MPTTPRDKNAHDDPTTGPGTSPGWLSVSQAAAALGVSPKTVWRRAKAGELTARKVASGRGGFVWEIGADSIPDATRQPTGQTERPDAQKRTPTTGQKPAFRAQTDRPKPSDRPDSRPDTTAPNATAGEVELLRDTLAKERENAAFLRGVIEQLQRDGAETRAALRKALELAPKELKAPSGDGAPKPTEAPKARETDGAAKETAQTSNDPQTGKEREKTGKDGGGLTYADVLAELEKDLGA